MTETNFRTYYAKYLKPFTAKLYEAINDRPAGAQPKLLFQEMLTAEHTAKDTWDSATISRSVVAADVVSLDSSAPLKSRGVISRATGKIPKLSLAYQRRESDIRDLHNAIALGGTEAQIATKLLSDVDLCVKGIEVAKEIMFLQGLSTGQTLVKDEDSDGHGIRVDFGYLDRHTFTVGKEWSKEGATPLSDLTTVLEAAEAEGLRPALMLLSRKAFNRIRASVEGRQLALRASQGVLVTEAKNLPEPSRPALLSALKDELGLEVRVIESTYRLQNTDGTIRSVTPWEEANVVFCPAEIVGRLVWSDPVERTHPNKAVEYAYGDQGTLISVYGQVNPLTEVTLGQAHAIPVIDGGAQTFVLETETLTAGTKKETKAKA